MPKGRLLSDKLSRAVSTAGLVSLIFVSGIFIAHFKWFPYIYLADAFVAGEALMKKIESNLDIGTEIYNHDTWYKIRFTEKGVTVYDRQKAFNGLTLYITGAGSEAHLIDMEGAILHKWKKPFYEAWPNPEHIKMPVKERLIHWRSAHIFPNGDILAVYEGMTDTPYGYGLIKLNKNSEIIWKFSKRIHHHFDVGADGKIYALAQEFRYKKGAGLEFFTGPILDDFVLVISPEGKMEKSFSVLNAFHFSDYSGLILASFDTPDIDSDLIHTNSVKIIDEKLVGVMPWVRKGQLLISCREMNVIALLDPETRRIVWAERGFWYRQHDIDVLDNGNMLIYDNSGAYGLYRSSRVVEFDPVSQKIIWDYRGDKKRPLLSKVRGSQQRLPNGNTMIVESESGRIVEVTKEKEIVWEYISPFRGGKNGELTAAITDAVRYDRATLPFLKSLKSKK